MISDELEPNDLHEPMSVSQYRYALFVSNDGTVLRFYSKVQKRVNWVAFDTQP